jgi:uncharacterized protein YdeI (YjbR/CyaY-like superfamily)
MAAELPELIVPDAAAWKFWLGDHHGDSPGVWLVLAKKGTSQPATLSYHQALEEALCDGWIDGQVGRRDAATYRQRFTPRQRRSSWSRTNVDLAGRLLSEGRMHPAGLAAVEGAKANGRWESAYPGQSSMEVPGDLALALALAQMPKARTMFDQLTSQNQYAILYRIGSARGPETRTCRVEQFLKMLDRGETIYPQMKKSVG